MTKIQWTDETWNPIRGCSIESVGCKNCYAMGMADRISRMQPDSNYSETVQRVKGKPVWTGKIVKTPLKTLTAPMRWRKPRMVFVNSMGDLFHPNVPFEWIDEVFAIMAMAPQHTFQILTKHPKRMREYICEFNPAKSWDPQDPKNHFPYFTRDGVSVLDRPLDEVMFPVKDGWPLPNVWLGVSAENQAMANLRIPKLLETPAAKRFVSLEPLLGEIDLIKTTYRYGGFGVTFAGFLKDENEYDDYHYFQPKLDWVIVGGESGPNARHMRADWVRQIVKDCQSTSVPVFVKQMGRRIYDRNDIGFCGEDKSDWALDDEYAQVNMSPHGYIDEAQGADCLITLRHHKGGIPSEWPEDLRIRQTPEIELCRKK